MRDIIEEIFLGNYNLDSRPIKKDDKAGKEYGEILDKIQKAFSYKFVTQLELAGGRVQLDENLFMFRQGFHLGALLMLELFCGAPQSAPK